MGRFRHQAVGKKTEGKHCWTHNSHKVAFSFSMMRCQKDAAEPYVLEHLAEVFPRHIQIHYGRYPREDLFEAARRSRSAGSPGNPTRRMSGCGVRTGASFVRTGETAVVVDRLPPRRECAESDDELQALAVFMEATEQAQSVVHHSARERAARQFDSDQIADSIITAVDIARLGGGIETSASAQSRP